MTNDNAYFEQPRVFYFSQKILRCSRCCRWWRESFKTLRRRSWRPPPMKQLLKLKSGPCISNFPKTGYVVRLYVNTKKKLFYQNELDLLIIWYVSLYLMVCSTRNFFYPITEFLFLFFLQNNSTINFTCVKQRSEFLRYSQPVI